MGYLGGRGGLEEVSNQPQAGEDYVATVLEPFAAGEARG